VRVAHALPVRRLPPTLDSMISADVHRIEGRLAAEAAERLVRLAVRDDGWTLLLRDPDDGRLWELTYPDGSSHGGGPPLMTVLTEMEAAERYPDAA
jgi:hypothetical protein